MARRKRGKENIRNIGQFAGGTYFVTLPVSFMRYLRWKERQKLFCFLDRKKKAIVVRDWKKKQ